MVPPSREPRTCIYPWLPVQALPSCLLMLLRRMSVDSVGILPFAFLYQRHSPFPVENYPSPACSLAGTAGLSLDLGSWEKWHKVWQMVKWIYSNSALKRSPSICFCFATCCLCPNFSCSWGWLLDYPFVIWTPPIPPTNLFFFFSSETVPCFCCLYPKTLNHILPP